MITLDEMHLSRVGQEKTSCPPHYAMLPMGFFEQVVDISDETPKMEDW